MQTRVLERMRQQLFAVRSFWIGWSCCDPLFCPVLLFGQLPLSLGLTFCAHEHVLIEYALEASQSPGLVQSAFVATHAGNSGRNAKGTAALLGFVPEPIARDFCGFVFTHFSFLLLMYEFRGSWFELRYQNS